MKKSFKKVAIVAAAALSFTGVATTAVSAQAPNTSPNANKPLSAGVDYGKLTKAQAQQLLADLSAKYSASVADVKAAEKAVLAAEAKVAEAKEAKESAEAALKGAQEALVAAQAEAKATAEAAKAAHDAFEAAKKAFYDNGDAFKKAAAETLKANQAAYNATVEALAAKVSAADAALNEAADALNAVSEEAEAAESATEDVKAGYAEAVAAAQTAYENAQAALTNAKAEQAAGVAVAAEEKAAADKKANDLLEQQLSTLNVDNLTNDNYKEEPKLVELNNAKVAAAKKATEAAAALKTAETNLPAAEKAAKAATHAYNVAQATLLSKQNLLAKAQAYNSSVLADIAEVASIKGVDINKDGVKLSKEELATVKEAKAKGADKVRAQADAFAKRAEELQASLEHAKKAGNITDKDLSGKGADNGSTATNTMTKGESKGQAAKPAASKPAAAPAKKSGAKELPNTGEADTAIIVGAGLIVTLAGAGLVVTNRKKEA